MNSENPTLAYLFRRFLATRLIDNIPKGRFLEVGVGVGLFYEELLQRGFSGTCLDLNGALIEVHQMRNRCKLSSIEFRQANFFELKEEFDLLVAFEVLEHYERDLECLKAWNRLLKPGGILLLSVPAHMKLWTSNDTRAGHARRYEHAELRTRLNSCGFLIEEFWCYGFPVLNLTYRISSLFKNGELAPALHDPLMTDCGKTSMSGRRKFPLLSKLLFREWMWKLALWVQPLRQDLGTGYIVRSKKLARQGT